MSVAEKLKAIADKIRNYVSNKNPLTLDDMATEVDNVYNTGYQEGYDYGEGVGYWDGYESGVDTGYTEGRNDGKTIGIEQGKQDAYDEFWDTFQQNGNRKNYISCFGSGWTPEIFKPKYQIKPANAGYMFFNNAGGAIVIPDFVEFADNLAIEQGKSPTTHPDMFDNGHYKLLDFSNCTYAIYALPALRSNHFGILDFSKCSQTLSYLFYSHTVSNNSVRKIDKFVSSEVTAFDNSTFQHAVWLTDITMSGVVAKSINFGTCPLNKASIISVVNVLSPTTTGLTVTFNKTAVNDEFGINVDDVSTYPVGSEFYNLRNSKPNWTFSYA